MIVIKIPANSLPTSLIGNHVNPFGNDGFQDLLGIADSNERAGETPRRNDDCGGHSVHLAADQEFAGELAFTNNA